MIAIGAHPYDIELGCGASLARLINDGYHVVAVVMTQGAAGCDNNINRHDESRNSLRSLECQQIFSPVLNKGKCFLKQEVIRVGSLAAAACHGLKLPL
ncbi:PIG-L family deacetylase [Escherichia coli]